MRSYLTITLTLYYTFVSELSVYLYEFDNGSSLYHVVNIAGANRVPFSVTMCNGTGVYLQLLSDLGTAGEYTAIQVQALPLDRGVFTCL